MDDDLKAFLDRRKPEVRDLALKVRALIREVAPEAHEMVHHGWNVVLYGPSIKMKGQFCAIAPHATRVNLQLMRGTELEDPEGLLEGTGKNMRHVKIASFEPSRTEAIQTLLRAAWDLSRSGS